MINHFFTHPSVLARLRQGVFAEFLDDYAKSLHDQGYSRESIRIQLRLIGAFGRWLKRKSIAFQEIDRGILDGFLRHRYRHHSIQNCDVSTLQRFLAVTILRQGSDVKQSPNQPVDSVPVIDEYREYLSQERGFAESTIRYYALFAARFLSEEGIGSLCELTHVRAPPTAVNPTATLLWKGTTIYGTAYGTASVGGSSGFGTVFKEKQTAGIWSETTLYNFAAL